MHSGSRAVSDGEPRLMSADQLTTGSVHVLQLWHGYHGLPEHGYIDVWDIHYCVFDPPLPRPRCSVVEKRDDRVMLSYHDGSATVDLFAGEGGLSKGGWRGCR